MQRIPTCLCQHCKGTELHPCPAGKLIEGVVDGIMSGEIVRSRPRRKANRLATAATSARLGGRSHEH